MAKIFRALLRNSGLLHSYNNNSLTKNSLVVDYAVRNLYTSSTLGIDGYILSRDKTKSQFVNMIDKFRTKMTEISTEVDSKNLVFTEDLKNMIHLAEESDLDLVIGMMKKFNQQNKELRFGSYIFGPVAMRMFYMLNKPNEALECFTSSELQGFFDQLISYQLLLDMLYENCCYDDVIKTFELIKSKQIQGTKYPKNIVVLTMAACYKKNSAEGLEYALKLWKELSEVGHMPMRRATTFCAGLALNLDNNETALEIISGVKKQNYMTVRNIKALALAKIGRLEDVLTLLRSVLEIDDPDNKKHTFSKDVIDGVGEIVEKQDNLHIKQEFKNIQKLLNENGHITNTTLDSQLCSEIEAPILDSNQRIPFYNNAARNKYRGYKTNNYQTYNQRPGLKDLK